MESGGSCRNGGGHLKELPLLSFVVRRLLGSLPLLVGVPTLVFLALSLAPGDVASVYLRPGIPPETVVQIRQNLGLDEPLHVRYVRWLSSLARGDLGYSVAHGVSVRRLLATALPNTLLLGSLSLGLSFALGILTGIFQALRPHTVLDSFLSGVSLFFYSVPPFWLGTMLVLMFGVWLGSSAEGLWTLPVSGMFSVGHEFLGPWEKAFDRLRHLVLPTLTLTAVLTGGVARFVRAAMLEVLGEDYILAARARGLSETRVVLKHAFRNALIPLITLGGLSLPLLLSGTVVVEFIFAWPGIGRLMVTSVAARDIPVVLAGTVLMAFLVVAGNLLADLLYGLADPRIRHGRPQA